MRLDTCVARPPTSPGACRAAAGRRQSCQTESVRLSILADTHGTRIWRALGSAHRANVRRRLRALGEPLDTAFELVTDGSGAARGARRLLCLSRVALQHGGRLDGVSHASASRVSSGRDTAGARARVAADVGASPERRTGVGDVRLRLQRTVLLLSTWIRRALSQPEHRPNPDGAHDSRGYRRGLHTFDMLWGAEPYKWLWATDERKLNQIRAFPAPCRRVAASRCGCSAPAAGSADPPAAVPGSPT